MMDAIDVLIERTALLEMKLNHYAKENAELRAERDDYREALEDIYYTNPRSGKDAKYMKETAETALDKYEE